jgi:hypothetical protein
MEISEQIKQGPCDEVEYGCCHITFLRSFPLAALSSLIHSDTVL